MKKRKLEFEESEIYKKIKGVIDLEEKSYQAKLLTLTPQEKIISQMCREAEELMAKVEIYYIKYGRHFTDVISYIREANEKRKKSL